MEEEAGVIQAADGGLIVRCCRDREKEVLQRHHERDSGLRCARRPQPRIRLGDAAWMGRGEGGGPRRTGRPKGIRSALRWRLIKNLTPRAQSTAATPVYAKKKAESASSAMVPATSAAGRAVSCSVIGAPWPTTRWTSDSSRENAPSGASGTGPRWAGDRCGLVPRCGAAALRASLPRRQVWLNPKDLPAADKLICSCGLPFVQLVQVRAGRGPREARRALLPPTSSPSQVYSPLEDQERAFHRCIYVFACVDHRCFKKAGSVARWRGGRHRGP